MSDEFDWSGLARQERAQPAGPSLPDLLTLPDEQRELVTWLMRREGAAVGEIATNLGQDEPHTLELLNSLVAQGFVHQVETGGDRRYVVKLVPARTRRVPRDVWQALDGL